ncbi:MAG TPA: IS1380 family transposase [Archangium sp.]|uniref:IS1380 family transposase n=1 Tax=Archangium sp. TaxID=1872627 RepID=UPI002EDB4717
MQAIPTRPYVQGSAAALELETTDEQLTDGAGLAPFRALWDRLELGTHLNDVLGWMRGRYRPALQIEQWLAMLLYGGTHMDHLPLLETRGVRALFGWKKVVAPTSFGRFVRQGGERAARALDKTLLGLVRARWDAAGKVPSSVMLMFDSTVVLRYGVKQAGAEVGYNPRKRGRPSHHPHLAFLDTGDCMGVRWRPGKANCAEGLEEWVEELVAWLRVQGVKHILVRLDKGYFKVAVIEKLKSLGVSFVLKMQESNTLQRYKGPFSPSAEDPRLEVSEGERWGIRMLCVRETAVAPKGELALGRVVVEEQATVLTNIASIDPITAWRMYNQGAQVEHRIEEMGQLGVGRTAVDDLGGNHLLWSLGALAYQMQHFVRSAALDRTAEQRQVKTLRTLLIRAPGKLVRHARKLRLKLMRRDPATELLRRALERIAQLRATPLAT